MKNEQLSEDMVHNAALEIADYEYEADYVWCEHLLKRIPGVKITGRRAYKRDEVAYVFIEYTPEAKPLLLANEELSAIIIFEKE